MLILLQSFRIIELEWACSSAGRAPALQLSRLNHISAASGVAYTQTYGAIIALNWTEVGRTHLKNAAKAATVLYCFSPSLKTSPRCGSSVVLGNFFRVE